MKAFPVVLELRFLWWTDPDVSTLADCDIPRTVRWGEMEYDFVAAILLKPGHWSVRVFHEDRLYSGQSGGKDWGCWLVPVKETGWDTTEVAWKMTPKNLGRSFPVRLYFTRRQRKNQSSVRKAPEGEWFRCGDTPCTENLPRQTPSPPTSHPTLISPTKSVENPVPTSKPDPTEGPTSPEIGNSGTSQDRATPLPPVQRPPPAELSGQRLHEKDSDGVHAGAPSNLGSLPPRSRFNAIDLGPTGKASSRGGIFQYIPESPPASDERRASTSNHHLLTNPVDLESSSNSPCRILPSQLPSTPSPSNHENSTTRKARVGPVPRTPVTPIDPRWTSGARSDVSESPTPKGDGPKVEDKDKIKIPITPSKRPLIKPPPQTPATKRFKGPDAGSKREVYMDAGTPEIFMEVPEPPKRKSSRKMNPPKSAGKGGRNWK